VIVGRLTHGLIRASLSDSKESFLIQPSGRVAPRFLPPMHAHDSYALCWVIAGRCIVEVPHRWVLVDAQNALLLQTGEEHRIRPTPQLEPFAMCSWNLSRGGIRLVLDTFAPPRRERVESFVPMAVPVMPLVERVARELQVRRPHYDLFVCTALLEIAAHILRSHTEDANRSRAGGGAAGSSSEGASRYVEAVIRYVDVSHGQHLTLRQLASTIGLSPSYLTSLFRRYTGRSVMAHIADVRHREALSLLRTTDLAVVEIAQAVGYDDPHYFGRTFKAREGCGPGQYRRLLRLAHWVSPEGADAVGLLEPRG
jgi:AraC-like DNA-binding protein/mannose-6-phosphate isomerase-like protein (cupin superfamily)